MLLDVLAKIIQLIWSIFFFLTCSAAEFNWTEIIEVVAHQYGQTLTDEQVNSTNWSAKLIYLECNPVVVARQVDYVFKQLWGKVILSGMHPIVQILNLFVAKE